MKRNLRRNKKGQIQGVDFALAMIIFMIMFAEVIVLSLTFLEPKYQNLEDKAFESRADQIADAFFASTGYPSTWEYDFNSQFYSFGLREIGSSDIDANKISRLNPQGLYHLSYESLKRNLSRQDDIGFQFKVESLFDLDTQLSLAQPTGSIDINASIGDCTTWSFVIAPNSTVIFTQRSKTDGAGHETINFGTGAGVLTSGYYTLVVFVKSPNGIFATDITNVIIGTETNYGLRLIVQEDNNNNGKAVIRTSNAGSLSTLEAISVYPYSIGDELLGNDSAVVNTPGTSEVFNLRIPTNGTCVVLLTGDSLAGFSRKAFQFPTMLSEEFSTIFGAILLPENKEIVKIERIVIIRKSIFKAVLYVWAD